jgi:3-phosphoshikimate 1-carboxyvinyltransferase
MMCAALAKGSSEIVDPLLADDTKAARETLAAVGTIIESTDNSWVIQGGGLREPRVQLYCYESAATHRFMTAICSLIPGKCQLTTAPSLTKRPIKPLLRALQQLGINCAYDSTSSSVKVSGGNLMGGTTHLPGNISSQFVSALILIAPLAERGMVIELTTTLESKPFVEMTIDCLSKFSIAVDAATDYRRFQIAPQSYHAIRYTVEGDWSAAASLLAFGALTGEVTIDNLNIRSQQGDKIILDFLRDMGVWVNIVGNSVIARRSPLKAIDVDLTDCIDLLPTLGILLATAHGTSHLTGIERARLKESNRVAVVCDGLIKMGVDVIEEEHQIIITGSPLKGTIIQTDDHRIAMAFGVLGALTEETTIIGAECVAKTFPDFWKTLADLGAKIDINE